MTDYDNSQRPIVRFLRAAATAVLWLMACSRPMTRPMSGHAAQSIAQSPEQSPARPLPYPVLETPEFARAVARGTRTRTGRPGPHYWQQYTRYHIEATLDTATNRLAGHETVRYFNRSPDTLRTLVLALNQNLFAPGTVRDIPVPVTTGTELGSVVTQGRPITLGDSGAHYEIDATRLFLTLPTPLLPGDSTDLTVSWGFTDPPDGAPREGVTGAPDNRAIMVAYWYPQLAVYDDVSGWQSDPYLGNAEFYMGYADYDVSITVPAGWLVAATGELTNPAEVLSGGTRERLAVVRRTDSVVHIVGDDDRGAGRATALAGPTGTLTWHFRADGVRDFVFATSDHYLWDQTIAVVGERPGRQRPDTTLINTFYRPSARQWDWGHSAHDARFSIEFLSSYLWPYPYPHATAIDGPVSCSGMEYPMLTCIGGPRDTLGLFSVIVHELGHMWFPMQVGSDERRYAWMDEGLTRFDQAQGMQAFFKGYDRERIARDAYLTFARAGHEVELMRPGDLYPYDSRAYQIATYEKMATNLLSLRSLLGDSTFQRAYREYGRRWVNKHPTPYDFWNTFADVSDRDLSWFWRTWWFETWTLDQAIGEVHTTGSELSVTIEDRGLAPMPVRVAITRDDGHVERREIPVDVWLAGARQYIITIDHASTVRRVEIDPDVSFPDIDRTNQTWTRP